jgi:hypothetical protein
LIEATSENEKIQLEMYLFLECMYFFIHMGMRAAHVQLSDSQMEKVQEYLGPLLFEHSGRFVLRALALKDNAEAEYTECIMEHSESDAEIKFLRLFARLGVNISALLGQSETEMAIVLPVSKPPKSGEQCN